MAKFGIESDSQKKIPPRKLSTDPSSSLNFPLLHHPKIPPRHFHQLSFYSPNRRQRDGGNDADVVLHN